MKKAIFIMSFCPLVCLGCLAQTADYPYLVENLNDDSIVRRSVSDNRGISSSELILRPNANYRLWMLESTTLRVATMTFLTPANGRRFFIPTVTFRNPISPDSDSDGLHDEAEFIIGTSAFDPDTDGDGIGDGAEFIQGLNPLDGLVVQTGVIASVDTIGSATKVHTFNDLAVLVDQGRGISMFNVFNAMEPVIIGQVDTPGQAIDAHFSGKLIAVADGDRGLAVIDVHDPPSAAILHQVSVTSLGGSARSVVTTAGLAYVGLSTTRIVIVDMFSGTVLETLQVDEAGIQDMIISGDHLFALTNTNLYCFDLSNGLKRLSVLRILGSPAPQTSGRRLFAGSRFIFVGYFRGYSSIDFLDPASPVIVGEPMGTQAAIHDIVANGSGLIVAATSFAGPGTLAVSVYDISDPTDVTRFLTSFDTPGSTRAISLFNGLAYVADGDQGLQVVNVLAFDTAGQPPSVLLDADFSLDPAEAEEGKLVRLTALVNDDVQVRNVEFYIDGVKAATDGSFPFEFRFTTPSRVGREGFTVQVRASDTGGNATWSELVTVNLVEDATPPRLLRVRPNEGASLGGIASLVAFFDEPIDLRSLNDSNFFLIEAGLDGVFDSSDDVKTPTDIEWREEVLGAFFVLGSGLTPGFYRATVAGSVMDRAGNGLLNPRSWAFRVYDVGEDSDGDGIPDDLEATLGLDPDNPDSDGDGLFDGDEDFDKDGLTNIQEVLINTDPTNPDSDGDGTLDSLEDSDGDGLTDLVEVLTYGTNPLNRDSDADNFNDSDEIANGSNPLDPKSIPISNSVSPFINIVNIANPGLENGRGTSKITSILNQALSDLQDGYTISPVVSIRSASNPGFENGNVATRSMTILNQSQPDLVIGNSKSSAVTVLNQAANSRRNTEKKKYKEQ